MCELRQTFRNVQALTVGVESSNELTSSDRVSVVPVTARVAVGVKPMLQVGLLGPLVQSLHVEHVLLGENEKDTSG